MMKVRDIRPDPGQPRKTFDEESIERLAATYQTEGTIVPIEVDEEGVIVLGERRYRAAKLGGLIEIPVIVRPPRNRLQRQLVEEFHREGIPILERAKAVKTLRDIYAKEMEGMGVALIRATYGLGTTPKKDISPETVTAKKLGHRNRVHEYLAMVEDPEVRKAIEEERVEPHKVVELQKVLGNSKAKKFIQTSTKKELKGLSIHAAIRPTKNVPVAVKEAIAKGTLDFQDVAPVSDSIIGDERGDALVEELVILKKAHEADEKDFKDLVKSKKPGGTVILDKSQRRIDERRLKAFYRVSYKVSGWSPAVVDGIKDPAMRDKALDHIERIARHTVTLLREFGREVMEDLAGSLDSLEAQETVYREVRSRVRSEGE